MPGRAGSVHLTGTLLCTCMNEVEIIKASLPEHARLTLGEPGCLHFKIWQTGNALIWRVKESFVNPSAYAHHQQRTRASAWWAATAAIPRRYNITGLEPRE